MSGSSSNPNPRIYVGAPNPFEEPMTPEEQKICDRITELARMVATGMGQQFKVTVYDGTGAPKENKTTGDVLAPAERILIEMVRADCQTGKLGRLLATQAGRDSGYGSGGGMRI